MFAYDDDTRIVFSIDLPSIRTILSVGASLAATLEASPLFSGTVAKFDVVPATTMHRKFHELLVRIPASVLSSHGTTRQSAIFQPVRPVKRVPAVARLMVRGMWRDERAAHDSKGIPSTNWIACGVIVFECDIVNRESPIVARIRRFSLTSYFFKS